MTFKPMLAATVTDRAKLRFPFLASPKLDGIRCIIRGHEVLSRSLKPIKNKFIVSKLQDMEDTDGELIVGSQTAGNVFNRTTRGVMSIEGAPEFWYHAFDTFKDPSMRFVDRHAQIDAQHKHVAIVPHTHIWDLNGLSLYEDKMLDLGYEGLMLRGINSAYKFGRATERENSLWKLKQFTDGDLCITGILEGAANNNPALRDQLGGTSRSTHAKNMVPNGLVGTIIGTDLKTGELLHISPGKMPHDVRSYYFRHQHQLIGKIAKYKCFGYGSLDVARFATFQGLRDETDIS